MVQVLRHQTTCLEVQNLSELLFGNAQLMPKLMFLGLDHSSTPMLKVRVSFNVGTRASMIWGFE